MTYFAVQWKTLVEPIWPRRLNSYAAICRRSRLRSFPQQPGRDVNLNLAARLKRALPYG